MPNPSAYATGSVASNANGANVAISSANTRKRVKYMDRVILSIISQGLL